MEIRMILIGKSGSGKSATGNVILGGNYFKSGNDSKSLTAKCSVKSAERLKYELHVVDTPGMADTLLDVEKEVKRSMLLCSPGPHVFLLCFPMTALTTEDQRVLQRYQNFFGDSMVTNTIVVFTMTAAWKRDFPKRQFIEYINKDLAGTSEVHKFVQSCKDRHFLLAGKDDEELLLSKIFKIVKPQHYKNTFMNKVEDLLT